MRQRRTLLEEVDDDDDELRQVGSSTIRRQVRPYGPDRRSVLDPAPPLDQHSHDEEDDDDDNESEEEGGSDLDGRLLVDDNNREEEHDETDGEAESEEETGEEGEGAQGQNCNNHVSTSSSTADNGAKKKKSKSAPAEVSSRRIDFVRHKFTLNDMGLGIDVGAHQYKPVDPRVSNLHGHLDVDQFEQNYQFLSERRDAEIQQLRKIVAARKMSGRKGQKLRRKLGIAMIGAGAQEREELELKRLIQEKANAERVQLERAAKRAVKKKLQQDVVEGKRGAYFPKRRELRQLQQEAKFEEIRKRHGDQGVQKAIAKRRKKHKSRDAGWLPSRGSDNHAKSDT